jgi:hypothetical protein
MQVLSYQPWITDIDSIPLHDPSPEQAELWFAKNNGQSKKLKLSQPVFISGVASLFDGKSRVPRTWIEYGVVHVDSDYIPEDDTWFEYKYFRVKHGDAFSIDEIRDEFVGWCLPCDLAPRVSNDSSYCP